MNPMVDGWIGDDWFHNGAFRQLNVSLDLQPGRDAQGDDEVVDEPPRRLRHVHAGRLGRRAGSPPRPRSARLLEQAHSSIPTYDAFWRDQAVDKLLAAQPLKVPVMLVHSLWDQEDIYGAPAVYKAIEPKDTGNDKVFLVIGPWHHGQMIGDGSSLGALKFGSDTALYFRQKILRPFLDQYLKDGAPEGRHRPGHRVRDGNERLAAATRPGRRLRRRLHGQADAALPRAGLKLSFDGADGRRRGLRGVHLRSRQAGPLPSRAPFSRWATTRATPGRSGSSTTSARPPDARTS